MRSLSLKGWPRLVAMGGVSLALAGSVLHGEEPGQVRLAAHCGECAADCCVAPPVWTPTPGQIMPSDPGMAPAPAPGDELSPPAPAPEPMAPEAPLPEMFSDPVAAFDPGQSLAGLGGTFAAPNMIGDLFSTGGLSTVSASSSFSSFTSISELPMATPDPSASVVGIQRIAENNSPIPRDRVFVNYSFFDNTPLAFGGIDVHRVTPGFEKTFNSGRMSFEARFPFAHTLDTDLVGLTPDDTNWEFGNVTLAIKAILAESDTTIVSAGFAAALPTADDLRVYGTQFNGGLVEAARVENEATMLMPFIGAVTADPYSNFFAQGFIQGVFNSEDDDVRILNDRGDLERAGAIDAPNLLLVDVGVGYWIYQNPGSGGITGIAPTAELHWTRSLERTNAVVGGPFDTLQVGETNETFETLNAVLGTTMLMGDDRTLTLGVALPVTNDADTQFDYEARVLFNWFFGGRGPGAFPTYYR